METVQKLHNQIYVLLEPILKPIIGSECTKSLFQKLNYQDQECVQQFISKGLSYGIIAGSAMVKIPQIFQIVASKSGKGISSMAYWMETVAFCIFCAYNFRSGNPFSTYGEGSLIAVQNIIILWLLASYSEYRGRLLGTIFQTGLFAAFVYSLLTPSIISNKNLVWLQGFTIILSMASKIPQIFANWKSKSIGQLSRATVFLTFAGSIARVFTTLKEVDDQMLLLNTALAAFLNFALVAQTVVYPSKSLKKKVN